jgi:hypothetical protein
MFTASISMLFKLYLFNLGECRIKASKNRHHGGPRWHSGHRMCFLSTCGVIRYCLMAKNQIFRVYFGSTLLSKPGEICG